MFLTNLYKAVLYALTPRPTRIPVFFGVAFLNRYDKWYASVKRDAIDYHKAQLRHLDPQFASSEDGRELVRRRIIADAQGMDPLSPKYPN